MTAPLVSFVVPCYRLAHLLPECIDSILAQTYTNFEILVMNDRSPDRTEEVVGSYTDSRVIHVKNEMNLGHIRNYNKGISMSRGSYIWLISADDYLRTNHVLQQYVNLMESEPSVGYTACPGYSVKNGQEGEVMGVYGNHDCVVPGHQFLHKLLDHNFVLAASVMVRRECYKTITDFPLASSWGGIQVDMGWLGDWYLWCMFALSYDVGYFAEPMVCYRQHDLSMSESITRKEVVQACAASDVGMLWMIRKRALDLKFFKVAEDCLHAIANEYRRQGASKHFRASIYSLEPVDFEISICKSTQDSRTARWIRARFYDGVGNKHLFRGEQSEARRSYLISLRNDPLQIKLYGKVFLLMFGKLGAQVRKLIFQFRRTAANAASI